MQGITIQELGIHFVQTCFSTYWKDIYFIGFYLSIIICFLFQKNRKQQYTAYYTIFLFLTIFNPFPVKWFFSFFHMDDVYYRFIWLLPVSIVIGALCVHCVSLMNSNIKKFLMASMFISLILFFGVPTKNFSDILTLPANLYKVPDDVLEVSEFIHQDSPEATPTAAVDLELLMTLRQYDASIQQSLFRDIVLCWQGMPNFQDWNTKETYLKQKAIMDVIYAGDISNPTEFKAALESTSTDYLVFSKSVNITEFLLSQGAVYVAETDNYYIFRIPSDNILS